MGRNWCGLPRIQPQDMATSFSGGPDLLWTFSTLPSINKNNQRRKLCIIVLILLPTVEEDLICLKIIRDVPTFQDTITANYGTLFSLSLSYYCVGQSNSISKNETTWWQLPFHTLPCYFLGHLFQLHQFELSLPHWLSTSLLNYYPHQFGVVIMENPTKRG